MSKLNLLQFKDFDYPVDIEFVAIDNESLTLEYLSLVENKKYILKSNVQTNGNLVVGLAPYGGVAFWTVGKFKNNLINWSKVPVSHNKNISKVSRYYSAPPLDMFDHYMKQFTYRYLILFEKWSEMDENWRKYESEEDCPVYEFIEETLYDGTFDKQRNGSLLEYHKAGKPKKVAVKWHYGNNEYAAYFWFEHGYMQEAFDKFYGAHPETKSDLIIRIDSENKKYELALYRQGLNEPVAIRESAYQLIVFKNGFEDFHSMNYDQVQGAWIW